MVQFVNGEVSETGQEINMYVILCICICNIVYVHVCISEEREKVDGSNWGMRGR